MSRGLADHLTVPLAPPSRWSGRDGASRQALRWWVGTACLTAGGAILFTLGAMLGHAPGTGAAGVALLLLLTFGGGAFALRRQRAELFRLRGERATAERLAGEGNAGRARAEALLRECEYRLKWLSEGLKKHAVVTLDPDGRIVGWDKAAEAVYGYIERDVVGRPYSCLCLEDDVAGGKAGLELQRALVTGAYEERLWRLRRGGWKFWAEVAFVPMREDDGRLRGVLCLTRDISEQRQSEDALNASRLLYRNLTETARDVVMTFDRDGTLTSLNLAFQKLTGWSRVDWVGQPLLSLAHPDDAGRMRELLQCVAGGETTPVVELRLRLASGEHLAGEWMTTPQVRGGEVTGGMALVRDLTDRKKAEKSLRETEEKLRQAQKMEAVGRLAGGVAHDFNNLLTIILGYADLFLAACPDEELKQYAAEISKAGNRAATLTRQLLAFSRKTIMQPCVHDVNARIGDLKKMLQRLIGEDIELVTRPHDGPLHVKADPSQIEQVIMNLVVNARDAMPDGGVLTVATSTVLLSPEGDGGAEPGTRNAEREDSAPFHAPGTEVRAGKKYALLAVTDTGTGMDEHVKSHLFEPFFTTKEQGKGTGLGLAMVYGIVQQSEGRIEVVSAPGRGTTFKIYLPLTDEACPAAGWEGRPAAPQQPGTETILLVEDEEGVRSFAANALRLKGYRVLEATNGAEALALYEALHDPVHLLLTDLVMPCLGGQELARHLTRLRPGLKVLFMSGYPDRDFASGGAAATPAQHLQKPFSAQELASRVRQLLDSPAAEPARV